MKRTFILSTILMMAGVMSAWADCAETYTSDALTIATVNGQCVATFNATTEETLSVPKNFSVNKVVLDRGFNAKTFGTMVLPISSDDIYFQNGQLNTIRAMNCYEENGKRTWQVDGLFVNSIGTPHTPFLIRSENGNPLEIIGNSPITVHATSSEDNLSSTFSDVWEFRGTYTYKKWGEGDSQIGHVYGFAANDKGDNIKAGQFVRVAAGASVKPMRAYLYYNKKSSLAKVPANGKVLAKAAVEDDEVLPQTIEVVFKDKDGDVMSIAKMNTVTGEVKAVEGWFDLNGRRLNAKPTQKGTYFNNGKKVVIK